MKLTAVIVGVVSFALFPLQADELAGKGLPDRAENVSNSPQFEYLMRYLSIGRGQTAELNKLGLEGWELVSVLPPREGAKAHPFYFKRTLRGSGNKAQREDSGRAEMQAGAKPKAREVPKSKTGERSR